MIDEFLCIVEGPAFGDRCTCMSLDVSNKVNMVQAQQDGPLTHILKSICHDI